MSNRSGKQPPELKVHKDAPHSCDDYRARNPGPRHDGLRVSMRRRWVALARRRARRAVRRWLAAVMPAFRPRRPRPGWHIARARSAVCAESGRCRMHLSDLYSDKPLAESCALMLAARGGMSQQEVADLLGMTRQNVSLIERLAMSRGGLTRLDERSRTVVRTTREQRIRSALRRGPLMYGEIARRGGFRGNGSYEFLQRMVDDGDLIKIPGVHNGPGALWKLTDLGRKHLVDDADADDAMPLSR